MDHSSSEYPEDDQEPAELLQCGFRYALSLAHNPHDAEDLVQEAWLKIARRYGEVASRPLLFVAIRNAFIDQTRRRGGKELIPFHEVSSDLCTPVPEFAGTATDLTTLLQALRPVEREALFLHHVEGYTAEEIARLTGSPRNTVLSLVSRAMKKLHLLQKD
ncbi:MAG TPA: RNA polymerase sigma factor [Opitutaceae bacterium]|nr:RNA polymerase sigma factor [Opitutaceae bacterium]